MYVLEDLWEGKAATNQEYQGLARSLAERRAELLAELSKNGLPIMERFERTKDTLAEISQTDAFVQGFRMGARMMLDVLGE